MEVSNHNRLELFYEAVKILYEQTQNLKYEGLEIVIVRYLYYKIIIFII